MTRFVTVIGCVIFLTACGKSGLSGDYVANNQGHPPGPFGKMTFHPNGTVDIFRGGDEYGETYKVNGSKIRIEFTDGQVSEYTSDDKGCITNEVGNTYCKKTRQS